MNPHQFEQQNKILRSSANPHEVTKLFERDLCAYTGAPYAVAVNSCTAALMLAVAWHVRYGTPDLWTEGWSDGDYGGIKGPNICIPKRTYVSVPMSIIHAGGRPTFRDEDWLGWYRLNPLPVWDSARWFTSGMYFGRVIDPDNAALSSEMRLKVSGNKLMTNMRGQMVCLSFHASKTLGLEQGGCILHDNPEADAWLRRARFDGRTEGVAPKDDRFDMIGHHCYMNPSTAAQGILRLHSLPKHNAPLPNDPYPDLSLLEVFR